MTPRGPLVKTASGSDLGFPEIGFFRLTRPTTRATLVICYVFPYLCSRKEKNRQAPTAPVCKGLSALPAQKKSHDGSALIGRTPDLPGRKGMSMRGQSYYVCCSVSSVRFSGTVDYVYTYLFWYDSVFFIRVLKVETDVDEREANQVDEAYREC